MFVQTKNPRHPAKRDRGYFLFRRRSVASPARPLPSRSSVAGSGTGFGARWAELARARLGGRGASGEHDRRSENGRPLAVLVPDGGLGDVHGADDLVRDAVDFFLLVPTLVRIELHVERGGQHLGGEFFAVFTGLFVGLAEGVMLGEITIGSLVGGKSQPNTRSNEAVGFAGRVLAHHREDDLAGREFLQALGPADELASTREDTGYVHEIAGRNAR